MSPSWSVCVQLGTSLSWRVRTGVSCVVLELRVCWSVTRVCESPSYSTVGM